VRVNATAAAPSPIPKTRFVCVCENLPEDAAPLAGSSRQNLLEVIEGTDRLYNLARKLMKDRKVLKNSL